jgi:hypothetical protein
MAAGLVSFSVTASPIRVIDETAIPFTAFLPKTDFDQRYPGTLFDDVSDLNSGWYVIYEHESLSYYFGPILLESIGQDYLGQLTETVEAAVAQRPSIRDYRLELSYEPNTEQSKDSPQGDPASDAPSNVEPPPRPPEPKSGFWGLLRRIFGFG